LANISLTHNPAFQQIETVNIFWLKVTRERSRHAPPSGASLWMWLLVSSKIRKGIIDDKLAR